MTGPDKFIAFIDDDPRAFKVETKVFFHKQWNFNRICRMGRPRVSNRQNCDGSFIVVPVFDCEHDDAGTVFAAFLVSRAILIMPDRRN